MEVYERIRQLRKEILKLSQTDFGNKLGVNRDVINNIENNRLARPDQKLSLIKLMCKEFGVNEEWLLTGEGEPFVKKTREEEIHDFVMSIPIDDMIFKERFAAALSKMAPNDWELIGRMVERLTAENESGVAPVQQSVSVAQAEAEYIKNASEPVPPMAPAASNSTAGDGNGETA